jgi:hypothetical protein
MKKRYKRQQWKLRRVKRDEWLTGIAIGMVLRYIDRDVLEKCCKG